MKKTTHYKGHRWTNEELKMLTELWHSKDLTTKQVAEKINVTHYALLHQVRRMRNAGIRLAKRRSGNFAERHNQAWTQGDIEYLVRRRNDKATNEEIAYELGRTWNAVQAMIYTLRKEEVNVPMRGMGVRRLWDVETVKSMVLHTA